jgi:cytochrome c biogenesis protein CcmG/thiol:disulfide interchange protein DsbE
MISVKTADGMGVEIMMIESESDARGSRVWMYGFIAVAVVLGAARWHLPRSSPGVKPVAERRAMGAVELPQLGGGEWKLADHRGQVVLINYWATWCEPCREELPGLMQVARESGPKGLVVVGVSLDAGKDAPAKVAQFVSRYGIGYAVAFADDSRSDAFSLVGLPTTVLIDREGRVAKRYVGEVEHEDVAKDVATLLAES